MKKIFSLISKLNNNKWVIAFCHIVITSLLAYSFYKLGKNGTTTFQIILVSFISLSEVFMIVMTAVLYKIKNVNNKQTKTKKVEKKIVQN